MGGAVAAVESGYMKQQLVESNTARLEAIERGEQIVVGVNKFTRNRALAADRRHRRDHDRVDGRRARPDRAAQRLARVARRERGRRRAEGAQARGRRASGNIMPASIACAKAGVTTGEWGWTLREAFGEYRAPTGVGSAMRNDVDGPRRHPRRRRPGVAQARPAPHLPGRQARASTAIPTAPSRSRCARATPACRWSTRASA